MGAQATLASVTITGFLAILLARSLWHKTGRFLETVGFAQGYGLLPEAWTAPVVRLLIAVEATSLLALLWPGLRQTGGVLAAALFAGYGLAMALALARGRSRIECGCGGPPQIVSAYTLMRNGVLTLLALALALLPAGTVSPAEAAAAILAALMLSAIHATIERLASHLPNIRTGGSVK
ncbi:MULTISPECIES: MauE/DoxX family redox-associated membrane protein [unclassified Paracoccus (in: a-proteobacteria)]|uniref:MauE/DoxX family redox-associated membrane protein n=1 Tax=unclassified Paracoccus (in: a-proteobacteria) TaxID=2688777 RepID=UPI0012B37985|nr:MULTISPECIES: MauE/DoxX family redox-associated membrane protein [unclassified Paracoccus (in: a-proteobacteria)]UXU76525.1 hypothetical protein GB879_014205 [Paracoccus sp. SMMA_5]UXU82408.1 hypothetical protein GB880_014230 [Paracoccus sp. SMMA_5_TC]